MAIKISIGKINLQKPFEQLFPEQLNINNIEILNITINHLTKICSLPFHHRDPFDRIIVAQALVEELPIISKDNILDDYGIKREW